MRKVGLLAGLGVCTALVLTLGASALFSAPSTVKITPSPAYTAAQLNAYPGENWITPNGDLKSRRYSTLNQITQANVGTLKQAWKISLGMCPERNVSCGSYEANAVVDNGVMYIPMGKGDVYALDAVTGKEIWHYRPVYDVGYNVGTGGRNSGVALGEGRVYNAQRDGYLVALNQETGALIWKTQVIPWRLGGRLVAHPIYVNGILIQGTSGGDSYVRNDIQAFDATTGSQLWHWNIVPSPGQPGSGSWGPGEYHYGGGAMWNSGSIDTDLRMLYIGTGNPVPWSSRAKGRNLWTSSIVAVDLYTGVFRWGYQTTHHDNWDMDLPQSPILYERVIDGKQQKVLSMVHKNGWNFILDRTNGKPLIPTPEVKVPVSVENNEWPTQPIPVGDNVLDEPRLRNGSGRLCAQRDANWQGLAPDGQPYKMGCHYSPYTTKEFVVIPFEEVEWGPTAYSPQAQSIVACGVGNRSRAFKQIPKASQTLVPGVSGIGILTRASDTRSHKGNLTALSTVTNKRVWHQTWPAPCIGGSLNTASGITFTGETGGRGGKGALLAFSTATGQQLWKSDPMDAMATAPPMTYSVAGKQYVTILVGGQNRDDPTGAAQGYQCSPLPCGRGDYIYTYQLP